MEEGPTLQEPGAVSQGHGGALVLGGAVAIREGKRIAALRRSWR